MTLMCTLCCPHMQATQARVALGRLHDLLTAKELPPTVHAAPEATGHAAQPDGGFGR